MNPGERFWAGLPFGRGVTILTRDENGLVALEKPAGVLSHPNEPADQPRSLLNARYAMDGEFFEWTPATGVEPGQTAVGPQRLWLLNRLDSATSGVILAATSAELATEIRAGFKRKQVRKVYQALVFGHPRQPLELWRDRLAVAKHGGMIRSAAGAGNIPAECRMTLVRIGRGEPRVALLKLEPRTGRSHQLRVQCAKRGLPIIGDQTYGDFARNREFAKLVGTKRLFLHSLETAFDYEWRGRRYSFSAHAPLPSEFLQRL
ncbi:pseudouridine synthase [Opitutus sp. ER46]|uniref:RluA family pseudouridine synthase n=1 Tax=Opitutus sp. ER46 TaxID=2161864 RepID=UPI001E28D307|nr:pseudouridine synthase [Opitutus sp. ER46]